MEQIAFIIDHVYIYWSDIVTALAAAAAVCTFLAMYDKKGAGILCALLAVPMSLLLARLVYWYFRPDSYEDWKQAVNPFASGKGALLGAIAGCFLTALFLRATRLVKDLPVLLDSLCPAGCLGIALGRLAAFFNASDRGMMAAEPSNSIWFPPIVNPVSGRVEYRLATFLLQAAAAGLIFLALVICGHRKNRKNGEPSLLFLLLYGASQVVLDSTRYDGLYFRSNGFVSVVQVLCAVAIGVVVIFCAVRLIREGGWKKRYIVLFLAQAGGFSLAGYMEYYVQRHGNKALFAYGVMAGALAVLVVLTLVSYWLFRQEKEKKEALPWRK